MRSIALTVVSFCYILSISMWVIDETILPHTDFTPRNLAGNPINTAALADNEDIRNLANATMNARDGGDNIIDRIGQSLEASYAAIWVVLDLVSGTYMFNVLYGIGINPVLVTAMKLIMPLLIASQVIWFVAGRY